MVKLLPLKLLIYAEPLAFMVGITNMHGGIFHQIYLLPQLTITFLIYKIGAVKF